MPRRNAKVQVSPRIGISYPITDRGAVHLSYGHFFQIPPFEFLYANPNFRIPLTGNFPGFVGSTIGNANLEPQRTTMYEIGLQQELTPTIGFTLTGYYKDIRNLLGLEIHIKNDFKKFGTYVNRDYGAVRGITLSVEKRMQDGFGGSVDYTYQVAKGDASDPERRLQQGPGFTADRKQQGSRTTELGPAACAQRDDDGRYARRFHRKRDCSVWYPGFPTRRRSRTSEQGSRTVKLVLRFSTSICFCTKFFDLGALDLSVFVKVYNLFDTANELEVFGDTGRAGYTLELTRPQEPPAA